MQYLLSILFISAAFAFVEQRRAQRPIEDFLQKYWLTSSTLLAALYLLVIAPVVGFSKTPLTGLWIFNTLLYWLTLSLHEFGHVLFLPFGRTLCLLGGSFLQLALPFCVALFFVTRMFPFIASFFLFWFSFSCFNLAPYIADAHSRSIQLLTVSTEPESEHDWWNMLSGWGLLAHDQQIANVVRTIGALCCILAIVIPFFVPLILSRRSKK